MALWGIKDDKSSTGTVQVYANGTVTGTSTLFETEARVGDVLNINSTTQFVISTITSNTAATVVAAELGTSVNAVSSGANYTLNEKPVSVAFSEVRKGDVTGNLHAVYGLSATEMNTANTDSEAYNGTIAHTGWVRRVEGSGNRAGRVAYEVLVAGGITGDAADDAILPE